MDCSDATTDACCVFTASGCLFIAARNLFTAARSVPMGTDYVSTTACYATTISRYVTTLMADGTLSGTSGWLQKNDGRAGGIKKSRQSLLRELYRENTPVGVDGFEPPTLCL